MPTTQQVTRHRSELLSIVTLGISDLVALFRQVRTESPTVVRQVLSREVGPVLDPMASAIGDLSADWYRELRADAGVRGRFSATPAEMPPQGRLDALVNYATVTAPTKPGVTVTVDDAAKTDGSARSNVSVTVGDPSPTPAAGSTSTATVTVDNTYAADPEQRLSGGAQRLLMNVGRDTIADAAESDSTAGASWARVPTGVTCAFCTLLASRGAVYGSKQTAGFVGLSDRAYHDHCDCIPTPVFPGDDLPYDDAALYDLYQSSRDNVNSGDVKAILAQMRQDHGLR